MRIPFAKPIWTFLFLIIVSCGVGSVFPNSATAAPLGQNPYPDCPPNADSIWVQVDTNDFGEDQTLSIPFDSGEIVGPDGNTYVNYLLGVLLTEAGPAPDFNPVSGEFLKAMAIMIRTGAYRNCGCEIIENNEDCSRSLFFDLQNVPHRGMSDDIKQAYDPRERSSFSEAERERYQRAIDDTAGVYMTYAGRIFDVQYRASSANFTAGYGGLPHISVYDPAGEYHQAAGRQPGFPQKNANHYATGQNHDEPLPRWSFLPLLGHYLSGVEFRNIPNVRNDYRFNVLQFGNLSDNQLFYTTNRRKDDIVVILQNTGTLDWRIGEVGQESCDADSYNLALSYHLCDDNNDRLACDDPDTPGGNPCFEGERTPLCLPGRTADLRPGEPFVVDQVTVILPPDLPPNRCYSLRWDIVLLNNHQQTAWISHLQENPAQAQWPTQDVRICYFQKPVAQNPDPPAGPYASSDHKANEWSNQAAIAIAWNPPATPVTGYETRYQGVGSNLDDDWHFTTQTNVAFTAAADGSHSLQLRSVRGDKKSRTVEVGPYLIDRWSPSLQVTGPPGSWVTISPIRLSWTGSDTLSGLSHYDVYQALTSSGPWTALALNTSAETVSLTGAADQTYYFKIVAHDRAGNTTERRKTVQVRTFPYLSVSPDRLAWTVTLTDTAPSVRSLRILNNGGRTMPWTAETNFRRLTLAQATGLDDTTMPITLTHPLTYGLFTGLLTVTGSADTRHSPAIVPIKIEVVDHLTVYLPLIFNHQPF